MRGADDPLFIVARHANKTHLLCLPESPYALTPLAHTQNISQFMRAPAALNCRRRRLEIKCALSGSFIVALRFNKQTITLLHFN
jgi:hypothetical protein